MDQRLLYQSKKIFYRTEGRGKPVVFIHGLPEDNRIWERQVEFLRQEFRMILPDLPGSGQSELIEDMSMEGMAEVIHQMIHAEGIESCPVIGHSMGGYIALALGEQYPNHVSALGLFHSTAFADSDERREARTRGIAFIERHGAFEFLKSLVPNLFSPVSRETMAETVDDFISRQRNFSPVALVSYYQAMMERPDRTRVLKDKPMPVLFVIGKYDTAVMPEDALKQCHLPELSYIHLLRNSAHLGMLEETEKANRIVKEFLMEV